MANKTSKKSAKVAKKVAAKRVAAKAAKPRKAVAKSQARKRTTPTLLAGGNPQIANADGDVPVQAAIAAMPLLETGRRAPPRRAHRGRRAQRAQGREVELALLWHGGPGLVPQLPLVHEIRQSGFLPRRVAASCPPVESKHKEVRYFHIHEDDQIDEELAASWIRQASELPGWVP